MIKKDTEIKQLANPRMDLKGSIDHKGRLRFLN